MIALIKFIARSLVITAMLLAPTKALAADPTPVGLWKIIDDNTGKARGLMRIADVNGVFEGKLEKTFPKPGDEPNPRCEKCDGPRRNQPVLGMIILSGLTKQGDEFQGGEILDPENGTVYRAKIKLLDGGKKLEVRGFIGFSLFGRSQVWLREE
jgi:uncharacterized protein (DUF2147 family)